MKPDLKQELFNLEDHSERLAHISEMMHKDLQRGWYNITNHYPEINRLVWDVARRATREMRKISGQFYDVFDFWTFYELQDFALHIAALARVGAAKMKLKGQVSK